MAGWLYNRPSEHCDEHEIKVAKLLAKLSKRWSIRWGFYYTDNPPASPTNTPTSWARAGRSKLLRWRGGGVTERMLEHARNEKPPVTAK